MDNNWDFTLDSEIQSELAQNIKEAATNYELQINNMYNEIASLGDNNYWVGEDYNLFKTTTDHYKGALMDLSDTMLLYSNHFQKMSVSTEKLASELIEIINSLTNS